MVPSSMQSDKYGEVINNPNKTFKTMKKLFLLSLLSFLCLQIVAGNRTEMQMKNAAINVLKKNTTRSINEGELKEYLSLSKLKIYGYDEGGFAVIASDDRFDSVIGYSSTQYNDTTPCGFEWWIKKVNENMTNINDVFSSRHQTRGGNGVSALVSTSWGQERPFNDNCTFTNDNKTYQCVTGCVATALAQIMNYYKFPECGTGSFSYDIKYNNSFSITFSEDFSQSVYDWSNMLDSYASYSKSTTKDVHTQAVAKLMKDCGVAIKTSFSDNSHGSSSNLSRAVDALKTYFYYDSSSKLYSRSSYEKNEWMDLIYNSLDNGKPILYSGSESDNISSSGHAFVLHGYDSSGKVLVNWGWDGRYDGYFDIDLLNPDKYQYNYRQSMIIAIPGNNQPSTQLHTVTLSSKGPGTVYLGNRDGQQVRETTLSVKIKDGNNAVLLLSPDIGCALKSIKVNNNDVTSSVVNNEYAISNIQSSTNVDVEFEKTTDVSTSDYNTYLTCITKSLATTSINSYVTKSVQFEIMNSGNQDVYITKIVAKDPSTNKILLSSTDTSVLGEIKGGNSKLLKFTIDDTIMPVYEFEYTLGNTKYVYESAKYVILSITSNNYGNVSYLGISVGADTKKFSIDSGKNATISLSPIGESVFKKLLVNSKDVTSGVSNNQYTINNITSTTTVEATFESPYSIDGHEYVDLGLPSGKLWSTMNFGAKVPEDYGTYVSDPNIYFGNKWGDKWKTPEKDEMQELISKCEWTWTELNGVKGYRIKGPNNNTMFLPAAGESDSWGTSGVGTKLWYFTSTKDGYGSSVWLLYGTASEYKLKSSFVVIDKYTVRPISTVVKEPETPIYTLSIKSTGNGTAAYDQTEIRNNKTDFKLKEGSTVTINFKPDNGYRIKTLTENQTNILSKVDNSQYVINNIAGDTNIEVEFEAIPPTLYKLTYLLDGEVYKEYQFEEGATITPEPAPTKEGYTFSGWSEVPSTMPAHDVTVTGTFTQIKKSDPDLAINSNEHWVDPLGFIVTVGQPYKSPQLINPHGLSSITWTSSDPSVATVNDSGVLTLHTMGKTQIKASFAGNNEYNAGYAEYSLIVLDGYKVTSEGTITITSSNRSGEVTIETSLFVYGHTFKVTAIGDDAFKDNTQITKVTIPDGISVIGTNAFSGCVSMLNINIGKSVTSIGNKAFANVGTSSSARTRGENAFTVNCYAESVPQTATDAFENSPIATGTLLVNDNIVDRYKTTSPWSGFGKIQGFQEAAGIGSISIDNPNAHIYDMQGNRIDNLQKGVNIIRLEDGKTKKVIVK